VRERYFKNIAEFKYVSILKILKEPLKKKATKIRINIICYSTDFKK